MLQENCYVVSDETKECVIIDCGAFYPEERNAITHYIQKSELKPVHLLVTHGHLDHNFGNDTIYKEFGLKPEVSQGDEKLMKGLKHQAETFYQMQLDTDFPPIGHTPFRHTSHAILHANNLLHLS
jgi:hydroxyacylglutathione hydrolase